MRHVPVVSLVLVLFAAFAAGAEPSLIIVNGKVFTGDSARPSAQAIAIEGNRILEVGSNDEIRALATRATQVIDADKRLVVPGINDAHTHPGFGAPMFGIDVGMDPSWENMHIALAAADDETAGDAWIRASIGPTILADPSVNAASLQQIVGGTRKVVLTAFTGHGAILSTAALEALGIPANPTDPEGGWYGRDANGALNGRVFEYAQYPLMRKMAEMSTDEDLADQIRAFASEAIGYGITSVQAMPGVSERRFRQVLNRADVPLRVRVIQFLPGERVEVDAVKWILDGTPLERNAALRTASYTNNGGRGRENFTASQVIQKTKRAVEANQQILVHAVGDKTIATALEAFRQVGPKRPRLEHGDGLQRDLFPLAKRTGVVVVQNPSHFMFRTAFPAGQYSMLRSIADAGIPIALGSDGPLNPWLNMMFAAERPDIPAEALKREQVLAAYTAGSAFAEMKETEKGKIAPGMLADLAILSQNVLDVPAAELPATHSVLTIIDGKIVHSMLP